MSIREYAQSRLQVTLEITEVGRYINKGETFSASVKAINNDDEINFDNITLQFFDTRFTKVQSNPSVSLGSVAARRESLPKTVVFLATESSEKWHNYGPTGKVINQQYSGYWEDKPEAVINCQVEATVPIPVATITIQKTLTVSDVVHRPTSQHAT